jgi:ribosomal protein S18 acetylase RimI-like enzyme
MKATIVPFSAAHLDGAAALLAERHARHRAAEPLLPDATDFRAQIEREWETDGAGGAAAVDGGEVVGYLIGQRREDPIGPHVWSHLAGQALREPELVRDLYRLAAKRWVEDGLTRHFVFVPALPDLVDPWFRLSFGASAALAARETAPQEAVDVGVTIRPSTPDDLLESARLDRRLWLHLRESPSFSDMPVEDEDRFVDEWRTTWDEPQYTHFVADRGGEIVGHVLLYRRPEGDLRVPPGSIANALTEPGVRGSGVGVALTAHVLAWAYEHGYSTMITDWRMTNLEASRFWPKRGFRETFLRLYRSIP